MCRICISWWCCGELLIEEVYTAEQNRRLEQAANSDKTVMIRSKTNYLPRFAAETDGRLTWRFR